MRVLPIHKTFNLYSVCCGKTLCSGCSLQHCMMKTELAVPITCPFCRTAGMGEGSDEEHYLVQLRKRTERKDPTALRHLAMAYRFGGHGLSVDQAKCIDLLREAADLGTAISHYQLATFHRTGEMGLEQNEEVSLEYMEKAAEGGDVVARHNLGSKEIRSGNVAAGIRHFRLAASVGYKRSMEALIEFFEARLLHHADLAESTRAFYCVRDEMKSKDRDQFIKHLKETGKYKEEFDM